MLKETQEYHIDFTYELTQTHVYMHGDAFVIACFFPEHGVFACRQCYQAEQLLLWTCPICVQL
jgi:hypothetical protein